MKRKFIFNVACLMGIILISISCDSTLCTEEFEYDAYEPIYGTMDDVRSRVHVDGPTELSRTGSLYIYGNILLIGEPHKGIHLFDNSDPISPTPLSFIALESNFGLSVRNDILYVDNYSDLYLFDISNATDPVLVNRVDNVFTSHYAFQDDLIVLDYKISTQTTTIDCGSSDWFFEDDIFFISNQSSADLATAGQIGTNVVGAIADLTGTGGSLARFTIASERLFAIDESGLEVFDISDKINPTKGERVELGWGIETIFPYQEYLLFGSQAGMFIYDISNPDIPEYVSEFTHARVCDPVFASDDRAYVTLRNGNDCQGFINQLDVLDISDLRAPSLISSYDMDNPHGLSVRNERLFICEGDFGLKVFDKSEDHDIIKNELDHVKNIHATDIISISSDHIIVVGRAGIFQYDTSDPSDLKLMSHIVANNG